MLPSFVKIVKFIRKLIKLAFLVRLVVSLILHICPEFFGCMVCGRNARNAAR